MATFFKAAAIFLGAIIAALAFWVYPSTAQSDVRGAMHRHLGPLLPVWVLGAVPVHMTNGLAPHVARSNLRHLPVAPLAPSTARAPSAAPVSPQRVAEAPVVLNCDREAARAVLEAFANQASVSTSGGVVRYEWGPSIDNDSPDRRLRKVRLAADADACMVGTAREIRHYVNGEYFAIASPTMGIRLMN